MKLIMFVAFILIFTQLCFSQVYQEFSYIIPGVSGVISFDQPRINIQARTNTDGYGTGDGWDWFNSYCYAAHGYHSFSTIYPVQGYHISSVRANLHLFTMFGNEAMGVYPIFDTISGQYEPLCFIEHVDFGISLENSDVNTPLLHPSEVFLSEYTTGWVSHDITNWVLDDINQYRFFTQFRIRFENDSDWDLSLDGITFDDDGDYTPHLIYTFEADSTANDDEVLIQTKVLSCYPNPFNPETTIKYDTSKSGKTKLEIYNVKGQLVKKLIDGDTKAGSYATVWNGKDDKGKSVSPGVYLYRLTSNGKCLTNKMLLLK